MDKYQCLASLKESIPEDIRIYLREALNESWPFVPEPWQSPEFGLPGNLPQALASKNSTFRDKTNYEVLKLCLQAAMKEELYCDVIAIIFVVDRYAYWLHHHETEQLLDIVQTIVDLCPEISIPPQLIIRKIRLLKDLSQYQQANKVTTWALVQLASCFKTDKRRLGSWCFKTEREYLLIIANTLHMKGHIQYNMGNHVEAAVFLAASGQLAYSLDPPDIKLPGHCLQFLTDIALESSAMDRSQLLNLFTFKKVVETPLLLADKFARNACRSFFVHGSANFKQVEFYYWKQMRYLTTVTLYRAINSGDKQPFYYPMLQQLYQCFPKDVSELNLQSQEIVLDLASKTFLMFSLLEFYNQRNLHLNDLKLAKTLFKMACEENYSVNREYVVKEVVKAKEIIETLLGAQDRRPENQDDVIDYPLLRDSSPMSLLEAYSAEELGKSRICPLAEVEIQFGDLNVDPLATTVLQSVTSAQPKIFVASATTDNSMTSATSAITDVESRYQSLLSEPAKEICGFDGPQRLLTVRTYQNIDALDSKKNNPDEYGNRQDDEHECVQKPPGRILQSSLTNYTIYMANIAKYHTLDDQWRYQKTLVYVHDQLQLNENKKGGHRDVIKLQYLHQEDYKGMYVGKCYRKTTSPKAYHNDVIMHQLARHYVSRFNRRLHYSKFGNRIHMVPVIYMEILAEDGEEILEVLNVEPYISGAFIKMTNNFDAVHQMVDSELLLAFTHFTWCESEGKLMVMDLQGWVSKDPQVPYILTDPAVNSSHLEHLGIRTNMGSEGIRAFWTRQHPTCNEVCRSLGLERDIRYEKPSCLHCFTDDDK